MKLFTNGFCALMRRNLIYRKRNWMATIAEFALPILACFLLAALKETAEKSDHFKPRIIEANLPSDRQAVQIFSFTDYVTALQAKRICLNKTNSDTTTSKKNWHKAKLKHPFDISGMPEHSRNWQVPFIQCDSRLCQQDGEEAYKYCRYPKLGLAAKDADDAGGLETAQEFRDYIYKRYPQLSNSSLPALNSGDFVQLFDSDQALEAYTQHPDYGVANEHPTLAMAIVFSGDDKDMYDYTIRVNSTNNNAPEWVNGMARTTPDTNRLFASFAKHEIDACGQIVRGHPQGPLQFGCTGQYILNGLLTMQRFVHDWIMVDTGAFDTGLFVAEHGVKFVSFPSKPYAEEGFYKVLNDFLPLIMTLGFLYPCASMISYIALEREVGQKEFLRIMGAKEWEIGTSWFCTFFSLHSATAFFLARVSLLLFENSDKMILWMFWHSTLLAFIVFSSLVPSLISWQAKTASRTLLIGLLIFLSGYFMSQSIDLEDGDPWGLRLLCLHPVAAFGYGVQEIGRLEDAGAGATWHSFQTTDSPSGFTVYTALCSLWLDCLFGTLLSWYFNRALPGSAGGHTLPWTFPFQWSYWFPVPQNVQNGSPDEAIPLRCTAARVDGDIPVEPVSDSLRSQAELGSSLEIHNLQKVFAVQGGGSVAALHNLNLSLHQGQVTALLGHNGSGKSTTINLLTGSLDPTSGFHVVGGKHSLTQMSSIRQDLGICLQHNDCLFPNLTVQETIQFFDQLKSGHLCQLTDDSINQALEEVSLGDKGDSLVSSLSGGMKRKLCVAVAFCGDSKVIILDEPTSGMDPFSRRSIWNLIKRKREGKIILLTTHFLDEADILADKIAILADGRLQCVGSSLFLKRVFGVGYQLTLEKTRSGDSLDEKPGIQQQQSGNSSELLIDDSLDQRLEALITNSVRDAKLSSTSGNELMFHLPLADASKFSTLLGHLDAEVNGGSLSSFGVSMTTLDEVFQKTTKVSDSRVHASALHASLDDERNTTPTEVQEPTVAKNWEGSLYQKQAAALLRKRMITFTRDKKAWCCTTILPGLFVLVGFLSLKYASSDRVLQPLRLNLADYNPDLGLEPHKSRNPVPFNKPSSQFKCQPGWCSYQLPVVEEKETNDRYFFCGGQSYLLSTPNCSQHLSGKIMDRLTADGVSPIGDLVRNVNESSGSILHSADQHASSQYGAIYFTHDPNSTVAPGVRYDTEVFNQCHRRRGQYMREEECALYEGLGYVISYNFTSLHASPLFQTLADEAIIREALDSSTFRMSSTIHPLPRTLTEKSFSKQQDVFNLWFMVVLSFPFISGHVVTFIVDERQSKAKHLQTIAGVGPTVYWLSNLAWDMVNYQIPLWFTVMLMYVLDVDVFTTSEHCTYLGVVLLLLLFGPAATAFAYCVSFFFTSGSLCNIFIIIIGFLTGMVGPIASFTLRLIAKDPDNPWERLVRIAKLIEGIGLFFPSFCMGKGLFYSMNISAFEIQTSAKLSVFDQQILLFEVIALPLQTIAYTMLAVCLDRFQTNPDVTLFCRIFKSFLKCNFATATYQECGTEDISDDDDVIAEEERIESNSATANAVAVRKISKVFSTGKVAVSNLSLGICSGQCFGLLGSNGAGKTTTMSILTSEILPTTGSVVFDGQDISEMSVKPHVGFCPQFDAIFEGLTGREQLEFYAAIKGMHATQLTKQAEEVLSQVGIGSADRDRLALHYSGGQKRKLSLACALIGNPSVVFFDEVTTGVDPGSRREIWNVISQLTNTTNAATGKKPCAVLTTHSMEECEALCSRIGIMSRGRLICLGSAQRLKSKFGHGYQIELKVKQIAESDTDFAAICERLRSHQCSDIEATAPIEKMFFNIEQTHAALTAISGDDSLSSMVTTGNFDAANIFNEAHSTDGVSLPILAIFVASQLRMQNLDRFVSTTWGGVRRERQDMKVRYEISSSDSNLRDIFSDIEENKDKLWLSEYSVNQTSLEQVFNTLIANDSEQLPAK